ncbi:Uncharacterised protein [Mycoplasmopsis columboralis]|uniref:Uncharacterized protein n=1 Tax=Mycoplasmopsis columboralis TaxID=171282 RepID=A0A449B5K6_9BACT|nr:Uncharacterised protein [Mycoplasmopsis columboralis]
MIWWILIFIFLGIAVVSCFISGLFYLLVIFGFNTKTIRVLCIIFLIITFISIITLIAIVICSMFYSAFSILSYLNSQQ